MTLAQFEQVLFRTLPNNNPPWDALYWPPQIHLVLFVHRVEGIPAGLYFLLRNAAEKPSLQKALSKTFPWKTLKEVNAHLPLFLLHEGDYRAVAYEISCTQSIASESCFSLGMLSEFTASIERYGAPFYKNLFWEAGMVGQMLYLEAENIGLRGTGIGCYFDDAMHDLLELKDKTYQSLYHFTVGMPEEDTRLTTLPGYEEEG